ncbi:MAG: HDOD domain-containing protein [Pseudomonadota bacterium]
MHTEITGKIGRFDVIRLLGKGSQGAVYLASDPNLDRKVAVKIISAVAPELEADQTGSAPLEGRISSRLKHPNIVAIYDAGISDYGTYMVFEFVEGETLRERLNRVGPVSIAEAAPIMRQVLDALAEAHNAHFVHLDLNPRNILMDRDGVPRVMDFGLSKHVDHTPRNSSTATGTLRYMAPEHFTGFPLGPYTDVFALGSTFYELVTGKHAMDATSIATVMKQIQSEDVNLGPVRELEHSEAFVRFLTGALERNVDGRYACGATMRDAFDLFLAESGIDLKADAGNNATVEFLLRRMQRKQDFPSVSQTLIDINKMTGEDKSASADRLANVVLRDFALTNKILKLANSAFYGARASEVTSISQAIVLMGVPQLRMIANSLAVFGHLRGDGKSTALKDTMIRSLLAGMLARHLAKETGIRRAEEAFIYGMFQNLGEALSIYYFNEEYVEICELRERQGLDAAAASRGVLGVSYGELGAAVARTWQMPDAILAVIVGAPQSADVAEADDSRMQHFAVFANKLCSVTDGWADADDPLALNPLLHAYREHAKISERYALALLRAGYQKLVEAADVFEISVGESDYCKALLAWLDRAGRTQIDYAKAASA